MKPNVMLLNKVVQGQVSSFTVWADIVYTIFSFQKKVISVKGIPEDIKYKHDVGMGYWIDISVPTSSFDKVVSDIKNVFENDKEIRLCEDFTQTSWAADMLF